MTTETEIPSETVDAENAGKARALLATEKAYLRANHEQLAKRYPAQYVIIKGEEVRGVAPTDAEELKLASRMFAGDHCLVRSVHQPEDAPPVWIPVLSLGLPMTGEANAHF